MDGLKYQHGYVIKSPQSGVTLCFQFVSAASECGKLLFWQIFFKNFGCVFSCDQAALQMVFSVYPSVCPSVRLSHLFHYVPIIVSSWNFQELLTMTKVRSMQEVQRSKVKVTEVTTQLNRFRTVTPVWIHIWWWNDAYSLMLLRRGAL